MNQKLAFISFEATEDGFRGAIALDAVRSSDEDTEVVIRRATEVYARNITKMRAIVSEIQALRSVHKLTPARTIWKLGDAVFELTDKLRRLSLEIDGLYDHLTRDLGVKRMWVEKVIIFRRYIPDKKLIPRSVSWGPCRDAPRAAAENLVRGVAPR